MQCVLCSFLFLNQFFIVWWEMNKWIFNCSDSNISIQDYGICDIRFCIYTFYYPTVCLDTKYEYWKLHITYVTGRGKANYSIWGLNPQPVCKSYVLLTELIGLVVLQTMYSHKYYMQYCYIPSSFFLINLLQQPQIL